MKDKMIDNRKVESSRQTGIERVIQRKGDMEKGQGGKMGAGDKAEWSRKGSPLTPRKG